MTMAHPTRMPGFDYRGRIRVFVTAATYFRQPLLGDHTAARYVELQLLRVVRARGIEVTAYCILENHVHLLLTGESKTAHIPSAVASWKQRTAYWYEYERLNQTPKRRRSTRLWQKHFVDRVVRNEAHTLDVVRYIASDPRRSGLVESLEDYRWFGSDCWSRDDLIEIANSREDPYWWPGSGLDSEEGNWPGSGARL
jgi:REP element-mobilizing transposase RayT